MQYGETTRTRSAVPLTKLAVKRLYDMQLSRLFRPMRTLDVARAPDDWLEHTTWGDLLDETERERAERQSSEALEGEDESTVDGDGEGEQPSTRTSMRMMFNICNGLQHEDVARGVVDDVYSVLTDALPVGNGRCCKKGESHGVGDLCLRLR